MTRLPSPRWRRTALVTVAAVVSVVVCVVVSAGVSGCSSSAFPGDRLVSALAEAGRPATGWVADDPADADSFASRFGGLDAAGDQPDPEDDPSTEWRGDAVVSRVPAQDPTVVVVTWRRALAPSESAAVCAELASWLRAEVVPLGVAIAPDETLAACTAPAVSDVPAGSAMSDILDGARSRVVSAPDGARGVWAVRVLTAAGAPVDGAPVQRELFVALSFEADR